MQQNISLVYDLLFLIVFAVVAVCSWHKGFLASLAELIGAVFGVGIAVWASQTAAPQIYEKFLSASVANRVELALRESNGNIAEALQGISFLPESMQQSLLNLLNDAGSDVPAKIAEALQPLILPFVQVLLFVVLCVLVRWVFRLLVGVCLSAPDIVVRLQPRKEAASTACWVWCWAWPTARWIAGCWRWHCGFWWALPGASSPG